MKEVKRLIEQQEYQQAYECLEKNKDDSAEYYIYMASIKENLMDISGALDTAFEGAEKYPNNYELAFMLGNYWLCNANREKAYVQYLLAISLCDTSDKIILQENFDAMKTDEMNAGKVSREIQNVIKYRMKQGEYECTYHFLSDIIFSENAFLFKKVIDKWIRYYYIIMEITACEKNRNLKVFTADRYKDSHDFENVLREFKFAFRCICFGFLKEGRMRVRMMMQKYNVSAEFWVVLCKYSVHEWYISSVLKKVADIFEDLGKSEETGILRRYAEAFERINPENREIFQENCVKNDLIINYLDAEENETEKNKNINKKCDVKEKDDKISFILCANDKRYVEEVLVYLLHQNIPEDYEVSVFVIFNAKSMAQGYNIGMKASDAKYKIYIHQDTFIFDADYTMRLIRILKKSEYRMLGVAGTSQMPQNGVWWDSRVEDKHLCLYQDWVLHMLRSVTKSFEGIVDKEIGDSVIPVQCLDGVLIATGVDVVWREDIFNNFHFYDVSQGMEFIRAGYKVGVVKCEEASVLHEVSVGKDEKNEWAYEESRARFVEEYIKIKK